VNILVFIQIWNCLEIGILASIIWINIWISLKVWLKMWQFEFVWTVQTKDHSIIKLLILHFEKLFFRSLLRSNGHHRVNTRKIGAVQRMIVMYCNARTTLHTSRTSISTHEKVSQHTMSIEHMNNRWIRTHSQEYIMKTWEEPFLLHPYCAHSVRLGVPGETSHFTNSSGVNCTHSNSIIIKHKRSLFG